MFKIYFALLCFRFLYEEAESENRIEGTMTTTTKTEKKNMRDETPRRTGGKNQKAWTTERRGGTTERRGGRGVGHGEARGNEDPDAERYAAATQRPEQSQGKATHEDTSVFNLRSLLGPHVYFGHTLFI